MGRRGGSSPSMDRGAELGGFKIVLPHIHIYGVVHVSLLPPKLARGEPYAVNVLRPLAQSGAIGIHVLQFDDFAFALDRADPSPHVARRSRVTDRIYIARADALPSVEARRGAG